MEHTAAPSLHTCSRPRAPPARIITQCCSYDTDGHRPSAAELVQIPPIVMLILLCKKIFAWVDKVSLWNLSKIRAAFQTTFDRQPKCLATCPWTGSVTHWRQPQLHSCPSPLPPVYLAVILKWISTYSIVKLGKKYRCAFNIPHILYVSFAVGIFTLNQQLKFTWQE